MKLKATKRYVDRYTKKVIEEGAVIEADETRAKELISQYVAVPEKEKKQAVGIDKVAPVQQEE